ncbi:CLUMA_CG018504, isoform A [Clunio marinus]|uniref:CLUMA_CG018504, isoform A n=1 Tax=Clunio marinus TaxID=568069 RepID=A0A1J1J2K9_9DIPT|nr:CLUMA_CG018504, isoform A [Clunio marinus]
MTCLSSGFISYNEDRSEIFLGLDECKSKSDANAKCDSSHYLLFAKKSKCDYYVTFRICEGSLKELSKHFKKMFRHHMFAKSDFNSKVTLEVIKYFLFGEIDKDILDDPEMFQAARVNRLSILASVCAHKIISQLTADNVFEAFNLSQDPKYIFDLEYKCFDIIIDNFDELKGTQKFKNSIKFLMGKMKMLTSTSGSLHNQSLITLVKNFEKIYDCGEWNMLNENYRNIIIKKAMVMYQQCSKEESNILMRQRKNFQAESKMMINYCSECTKCF